MSLPLKVCRKCKQHIWLYAIKCNFCGIDVSEHFSNQSKKQDENLDVSHQKETYIYSEVNKICEDNKISPWQVLINIIGGIIFVAFLFWLFYLTEFIFYFTILFFAVMFAGCLYEIFKKKPQLDSAENGIKIESNKYIVERKEYVYILSNISMPGLIKIGRTNRSVEERLKELNNTSLPTQFIVEHTIETSDSKYLEKMIHDNFKKHRVNDNREFFRINHEIVIEYAKTINKSFN